MTTWFTDTGSGNDGAGSIQVGGASAEHTMSWWQAPEGEGGSWFWSVTDADGNPVSSGQSDSIWGAEDSAFGSIGKADERHLNDEQRGWSRR